MRIVHVVADISRNGWGVSKVVEQLSKAQENLSQSVYVVGLTSDQWEKTDKKKWGGAEFFTSKPFFKMSWGFSFKMLMQILRLKPDIIHVHGVWTLHLPIVMVAARITAAKIILSPHGMLTQRSLMFSNLKKRAIHVLYQKYFMQVVSKIHVGSALEFDDLKTAGFRKCYLCLNGTSNFDNGIKLKRSSLRANTFGYVGRIHPKKGIDILIKAWGIYGYQNPGSSLIIAGVGDRNYLEEIKLLAKKYECQNITFNGPKYDDEFDAFIQNISCLVLPTLSEGMPMIVGESLIRGTPVISTWSLGLPEIEESKIGLLCDARSQDLAEKFKIFSSLEKDQIALMRARCVTWAKTNMDWSNIALIHLKAYNSI